MARVRVRPLASSVRCLARASSETAGVETCCELAGAHGLAPDHLQIQHRAVPVGMYLAVVADLGFGHLDLTLEIVDLIAALQGLGFDAELHLLKQEADFWGEHEGTPSLHYGGDELLLGKTAIKM